MKKTLLIAMMTAALPACAGAWDGMDGQNSAIEQPRMVVVRDAQDWARLWAEHHGARPGRQGSPQAKDVPPVDFAKETVVAVFLGSRPTGGYKVDLSLLQDPTDPSRLFVLYKEIEPKPGAFTPQVVSRPFALRKVAKPYAAVVFEPNRKMVAFSATKTAGAQARLEAVLSKLEGVVQAGLP